MTLALAASMHDYCRRNLLDDIRAAGPPDIRRLCPASAWRVRRRAAVHRAAPRSLRQRSEQNFTSFHVFAQRFRQIMGRPHA
jgi:hypothetical protein